MQHTHLARLPLLLSASDLATNKRHQKLLHVTQESNVAGLPTLLLTSDLETKVRYKRHKKLMHVTQESHVAGLPPLVHCLHSSRGALTSHSFAQVLMKIFVG